MKKRYLMLLVLPFMGCVQSKLALYQKEIAGSDILASKTEANKYTIVNIQNNANASPYSPPGTDPLKRTIYNLTERGQKEFINALSAKISDPDKFLKALPAIMEPPKEEGVANPEVKLIDVLKKFEIDVDNPKAAMNSGRIARLVIRIALNNADGVQLSGFNNLTTKYQSVDFGTLSLNRVNGFTLNAGLNFGGTGSTTTSVVDTGVKKLSTTGGGTTTSNTSNIGASYNSTNTIAEQIAIKNNVITFKGSLSKAEAVLILNGVPNQDLSDNINLELIVRSVNNISMPFLKFKGLFDKDNKPEITDAPITITKGFFTIPEQLASNITGTVSYTFVYRDVLKGENTVT
ncbi:MAG TPA: hypothetical protein VJ844_12525, partial [Mucilaginibacter sp.]|nr:hypothetical protein [Mucilaginibacter sp.]